MTAFNEPIAHHLGWAVYDADVTAARYEQMLGAKFKLQPIYELQDIYNRPAKLKVYYGAFAGIAIEIIEPFEGETPHATFLREHGEGIQHLGIWVLDVKKATADMIAKGARLTWVYSQEDHDPEAARAAAQLTVASPYEELMEAVPANGLSYLDIKEGGTTIELLGPFVHDVIYRGGPLEGMEEWIQAFPPLDD